MVGKRAGFTLIELLVALAIIALLLSIAVPRYFGSLTRSEEAALRENLSLMRDAIDKHYADTGRYPGALAELASKKYLRAVPRDPLTQSADTWIQVPPADARLGGVFDVHSGALGTGSDGRPYAEW
jgi:general secretion pathway protein G